MHFEAEVVMQMTRGMFLNNEPAPASLPAAARYDRLRFGGLSEITFVRIGLQSRTAGLRRLHAWLCEIATQLRRKSLHLDSHTFEQIPELFCALRRVFRREEQRVSIFALQRV